MLEDAVGKGDVLLPGSERRSPGRGKKRGKKTSSAERKKEGLPLPGKKGREASSPVPYTFGTGSAQGHHHRFFRGRKPLVRGKEWGFDPIPATYATNSTNLTIFSTGDGKKKGSARLRKKKSLRLPADSGVRHQVGKGKPIERRRRTRFRTKKGLAVTVGSHRKTRTP